MWYDDFISKIFGDTNINKIVDIIELYKSLKQSDFLKIDGVEIIMDLSYSGDYHRGKIEDIRDDIYEWVNPSENFLGVNGHDDIKGRE